LHYIKLVSTNDFRFVCQKLSIVQEKMAVLSQGVGYGVVLGIGALFAGMADFS
jgi:hypothetical protein